MLISKVFSTIVILSFYVCATFAILSGVGFALGFGALRAFDLYDYSVECVSFDDISKCSINR